MIVGWGVSKWPEIITVQRSSNGGGTIRRIMWRGIMSVPSMSIDSHLKGDGDGKHRVPQGADCI